MYKRLSSVRRCSNPDAVVAVELQRAGIDVVPKSDPHPACPLLVQGRLTTHYGEFRFDRKAHYYEAVGPVPLEVAKTFYYELGRMARKEMRAGGHRHSLPPEQCAVPPLDDVGALADLHDLGLLTKHSADVDETVEGWDPSADSWESLDWGSWPTFRRLANLCNVGIVGGERVVGLYHIDSLDALCRFVAALRA